jgi:hydrogenase maturation protease
MCRSNRSGHAGFGGSETFLARRVKPVAGRNRSTRPCDTAGSNKQSFKTRAVLVIVVIGCGNPNRLDDGAGVDVLRLLEARGIGRDTQRVRLLVAGTDGMATMFAARGCRTLIVVDACRSGSEPGAVFEVPGGELEQRYQPSLNLHDFRWDHALFAGKQIFREQFPSDVVVLLIEVQTTEFGIGLSEPVSSAVAKVADRVDGLIRSRLLAQAEIS